MKSILLSVVTLVIIFAGCSSKSTYIVDQRTAFESYLRPEGKGDTIKLQSMVYKHTLNMKRDGFATSKIISGGDSLVFMFAIFKFESGIGQMLYTNIDTLITKKTVLNNRDTILNTEFWSFDPKRAKLGDGKLMKGVEVGLVGSREGDSVHLFVTSDLAYGGKINNIVGKNTPLVWIVKIEEVKNNN